MIIKRKDSREAILLLVDKSVYECIHKLVSNKYNSCEVKKMIKIYADAGSNLFPSILKEKNLDIRVIPMTLQIEDEQLICYEDKIDVNEFSKSFYEKMKEGKKVSTTLINPYRFMEEFENDIMNGNDIICFTMAKGISGTYQAAKMAEKELNEKYQRSAIHVIDSRTAGFGEGLQAIHAYELSKNIQDFDTLIEKCEQFVYKVRSEFTVDKIKYLARTGRVNPLMAKGADLLHIKIILKGTNDSKIANTAKVPGRKNAIKYLADTCLTHIDKNIEQTIYIAHCHDYQAAEQLKMLLNNGGLNSIEIYDYDLVTGSHVGPGALAIFYIGENRD